MTREVAAAVVKALEANGQVVSAPNVNRQLRAVPPHRGLSFTDLLPILRNQADPTLTDPHYQAVVEMAKVLEEALVHRRYGLLLGLIDQGERTWSQHAPAMWVASAQGDEMQPWVDAFERLRHATQAAIVQVYGVRRA